MDENDQFISIYDDFSDKIYRFIYYKTCHRETAEDITSLTFLKAMEKWHLYNNKKGSVSTWLYGIARNLIIDHYRKHKKWGFIKDINDIWDLPSGDNVLLELTNKEMNEELHQTLNSLAPGQREVIMLRLWDNLSYKEIAFIMAKSEASCKMLFSRALGKLKSTMETALFFHLLICGINMKGEGNER